MEKANHHLNAGNFDEATVAAKKAIAIAEKNVGPIHSDVAVSIGMLGRISFTQS